ncbi:MAG: serine/threonine protein kinase [Pseudonocardiales bacterium]|nr:serine/threonine protein kinase [Pseudonocardiales bacterium]
MRAGDLLHGYRLLEDFRVVGAGLSEWSFAERDGRVYFIKRFLAPTYPDDAAPGSPTTKARKRARCAAFEAHHRGIQAAMAPLTSYGGNLIATLDFFRDGAKYYKVTEKVDVAGLEPADIAELDFPMRLVLLKTVAHSLKILHDLNIVHGDLKPSNVLIKRTELGYTTKLIDFDSSYLVGSPPPPEEIVGTMNYYSPELVSYIQGSTTGDQLSEASDIFALGLIYAQYLTGALPAFDPTYHEAAIAVLHGNLLKLSPTRTPTPIVALVEQMLLAEPAARPTVAAVHATLMGLRSASPTVARPPLPAGSISTGRELSRPDGKAGPAGPSADGSAMGSAPGASPGSILRGKGLRLVADAARWAPVAARRAPAALRRAPLALRPDPSAAGPVPVTDPEASPAVHGRALLGKLLGKLENRRPR